MTLKGILSGTASWWRAHRYEDNDHCEPALDDDGLLAMDFEPDSDLDDVGSTGPTSRPVVVSPITSIERREPAERLQEYVSAGPMQSLFPPLPSRGRPGLVAAIILSALAVAAGAYFGVAWLASGRTDRPGVSAVEIPRDLPRLIDTGTPAAYTLTEREVLQGFGRAKKLLLSYRDNLAVPEINRLLLSNATLPVKERARTLKGFVIRPGFSTFRDGFPYRSVSKEPALYDGASVLWRGKVANLAISKDEMRFDFLVGYEQERELQGIVPVALHFAVDLQNGVPLEVLGRVNAPDGVLRLEGISLHRIAPP